MTHIGIESSDTSPDLRTVQKLCKSYSLGICLNGGVSHLRSILILNLSTFFLCDVGVSEEQTSHLEKNPKQRCELHKGDFNSDECGAGGTVV